jgi:hypothetical protein
MSQVSDLDQRFLIALDLALDSDHPDLPINEFKEALNALNYNRKKLLSLIETCPSLHTQFEDTHKKIPTNAEKNKGNDFHPAPLDPNKPSDEITNKFLVNDLESLLKNVLQKIDQHKSQTK